MNRAEAHSENPPRRVARLVARQFSQDGNFAYSAARNFLLRLLQTCIRPALSPLRHRLSHSTPRRDARVCLSWETKPYPQHNQTSMESCRFVCAVAHAEIWLMKMWSSAIPVVRACSKRARPCHLLKSKVGPQQLLRDSNLLLSKVRALRSGMQHLILIMKLTSQLRLPEVKHRGHSHHFLFRHRTMKTGRRNFQCWKAMARRVTLHAGRSGGGTACSRYLHC